MFMSEGHRGGKRKGLIEKYYLLYKLHKEVAAGNFKLKSLSLMYYWYKNPCFNVNWGSWGHF